MGQKSGHRARWRRLRRGQETAQYAHRNSPVRHQGAFGGGQYLCECLEAYDTLAIAGRHIDGRTVAYARRDIFEVERLMPAKP